MKNYNKNELLKFKDTVRNLLNEAFPINENSGYKIKESKKCVEYNSDPFEDYGKINHDTSKTKDGDVIRIKMYIFGSYRHWYYKSEDIEARVKKIIKGELDKKGWEYNWIDPGYVAIKFKK